MEEKHAMDTLILSSSTWHLHGRGNLGVSCTHSLVISSKHLSLLAITSSQNICMVCPMAMWFVSVNPLHSLSPAQVMISTISIHLLMLISSILLLECSYLARPSEFHSRVTNPMKFSLTRTTFFFLLLKSLLLTQYQRM